VCSHAVNAKTSDRPGEMKVLLMCTAVEYGLGIDVSIT